MQYCMHSLFCLRAPTKDNIYIETCNQRQISWYHVTSERRKLNINTGTKMLGKIPFRKARG